MVLQRQAAVRVGHKNTLGRNNVGVARLAHFDALNIIFFQFINGVRHAYAAQYLAAGVQHRGSHTDDDLARGKTFGGSGAEAALIGQGRLYVFAIGQIIMFFHHLALCADNPLLARSVKNIDRVDTCRRLRHGSDKNGQALHAVAGFQILTHFWRL